MKLNIYTEKNNHDSLKNIPLAPMITAFLSEPQTAEIKNNKALAWKHYWENCQSLFNISSLADAEFVVFPYDWFWVRGSTWIYPINSPVSKEVRKLSTAYYQKVNKYKRAVLFFSGDRSHEKVPFENAIVFREGLYQSQRQATDFTLPAFPEDLVEHYLSGSMQPRAKSVKPTVGFCGLAKKGNLKNLVKLGIYHSVMLATTGLPDVSPYKGEELRVKLLDQLRNYPAIETNFVIYNHSPFFANIAYEAKLKERSIYVKNLRESDYILCCRGSGNYSYRIYETLCMGRIPIFVNTDCGLPYDFLIDWRKYCVWVEEKELEQLPARLLDFHNSLSPQDFVDLQYQCRELWLKWLSPEGFFSNFHHHFK
ncbi:MAG: exostosin family protein [Symploca sp. SIO2E6]|nr:exostosin family protein [Symploca sp. SIO2E6]